MINSHLIGRIGKDAEIRQDKNGRSYMSMDVATDYFARGENKTIWIRVISNDPTIVEKRAQYFRKGSMVTIEGQQREPSVWIGKDGEAHAQIVVAASFIDFIRLGKKKEGEGQQGSDSQPVTVENTQQQDEPFPAPEENPDDLPF